MKYHHINFHSIPPLILSYPLEEIIHPTSRMFFKFLNPVSAAHLCMTMRPSTRNWISKQWLHPQRRGDLRESQPWSEQLHFTGSLNQRVSECLALNKTSMSTPSSRLKERHGSWNMSSREWRGEPWKAAFWTWCG